MEFAFPQYPEPTPIDPQLSWTATFDSYNQRTDDIYYVVTVRDAECEVARLVVQVWADDEASSPELAGELHRQIHQVAITGKTNTSYQGAMFKQFDQ